MPFALDFLQVYNSFINLLHFRNHIPHGVVYNEYNERQKADERKEKEIMKNGYPTWLWIIPIAISIASIIIALLK